jgi:hypothetical protein
VNFEAEIKAVLMGVLQGNLPEVVGAAGAYVTFKDKAYALAVTMDQIRNTALTSSVVGGLTAIFQKYLTGSKSNNGNGNRGRRRNRRKGGK